jgi:hypothetical protein
MINYKLRPGEIPIRIDNEAKTVTNVVNKPNEKILGFMTNEEYYIKVSVDAENWPSITEEEFNIALAEVKAIHTNI